MSPLIAALGQLFAFLIAAAAFALGRAIGIETGRYRAQEELIRNQPTEEDRELTELRKMAGMK